MKKASLNMLKYDMIAATFGFRRLVRWVTVLSSHTKLKNTSQIRKMMFESIHWLLFCYIIQFSFQAEMTGIMATYYWSESFICSSLKMAPYFVISSQSTSWSSKMNKSYYYGFMTSKLQFSLDKLLWRTAFSVDWKRVVTVKRILVLEGVFWFHFC